VSADYGSASLFTDENFMTYVYILRSVKNPERHYVGITGDLRGRLQKHNAGEVPHTSKYSPWTIKTYVAFADEERAMAFEEYLKSASGRAFAKKRL
jgi:predicted GIY-YIG superfamily endonuclease